VANQVRENGAEVSWLGTRRGIESRVVPASGIEIHWVDVEGLRGKGIASWLQAPFKLIYAIGQSIRAIRVVQPDCVLGMGGFASGPGGVAAWLMRKPLIVHEQNAVAGLTNTYLAKISSRVLSGFPNVKGLPKETTWVGNPVRSEIVKSHNDRSGSKINVLVLGGSQGARSLNLHLPKVFANQDVDFNIWHQTGRGNSTDVTAAYCSLDVEAKITEFIEEMAIAYEWADLLVCRAGAMTIAECCAAGKPAILVPFPHSAGDHQQINAEFLETVGGAIVVKNEELEQASMSNALGDLLKDKSKLAQMGDAAFTLHKANAVRNVATVCEEFLHA
jgi:UDP-N-acetylglucosamine--N-acetylmuramyl-(pentapeptide) pyrophosphoryl-undecaprenol N-acetylglucosamine transferase